MLTLTNFKHCKGKALFSQDNKNNTQAQQYIIIGGGPTGCYLAYKLLTQNTTNTVIIFEERYFDRPQVLRIPYAVANDLPLKIKQQMWSDQATRQRIFATHNIDNNDFWPRPGYIYWPWISIGLFQQSLLNYLSTTIGIKERLFFIQNSFDIKQLALNQTQIKLPLNNLSAIFCTCGIAANSLRMHVKQDSGKNLEFKDHGIYLIYQNEFTENYIRNSKPILYRELGKRGISYAASNNLNYDVQLYTYPEKDLIDIFAKIPTSFIQVTKYNSTKSIDFTGAGLSTEDLNWFLTYRKIIENETLNAEIVLPRDYTKIKVFYAPRTEYYWDNVVTTINTLDFSSIPLFFLGDSAGSTDWKYGLSLGRGLLAIQELIGLMQYEVLDFNLLGVKFQDYWNNIITREFNNGAAISAEAWIQYQYLIKGRKVTTPLAKKFLFNSNDEYINYLNEYQLLVPEFYNTTDASAILQINSNYLQQNMRHIMNLGQSLANSKIIAVVKSDGYGLGAKLIAELALTVGIEFLAVAKLQEAVNLRKHGIKARIMVFDTPLSHDLSTYAYYDIEVIIPSTKNANSAKILNLWCEQTPRINNHPLKVHIMIDTGMRRDGGLDNNLAAAVLTTLNALNIIDSDKINFMGIATHLACYRCTDYNGAKLIDYRSLQLTRLHHVLSYLYAKKMDIPMVHVGGGLGLLGSHWPKLFAELIKSHNTQLYTRVGHGLYGMEAAADLASKSPQLYPTVKLCLQVRNVFYIEEGEPVSYGGYWRAPQSGAWIATLSGGWNEGIPRTVHTLGNYDTGMLVSINKISYPVIGTINMNAMMINLGQDTTVKAGDQAVIFGWKSYEPKLNELANISGQIDPSITVNIPTFIPRIVISE